MRYANAKARDKFNMFASTCGLFLQQVSPNLLQPGLGESTPKRFAPPGTPAVAPRRMASINPLAGFLQVILLACALAHFARRGLIESRSYNSADQLTADWLTGRFH